MWMLLLLLLLFKSSSRGGEYDVLEGEGSVDGVKREDLCSSLPLSNMFISKTTELSTGPVMNAFTELTLQPGLLGRMFSKFIESSFVGWFQVRESCRCSRDGRAVFWKGVLETPWELTLFDDSLAPLAEGKFAYDFLP